MRFGFGAASSDPRLGGWRWWLASFDVQVGNDDELQAAFIAPVAGTYSYAARVSLDGGAWTYCDLDGAGSNGGLSFEPTAARRADSAVTHGRGDAFCLAR